jgi:putative membrane protein
MRLTCWIAALLVATANGATRRSDLAIVGLKSRRQEQAEPKSLPEVLDKSTEKALVASSEKKKSSVARRPELSAGLRYSSNDWLWTFLTTPTSFILRRISSHLLFSAASCFAVMHFHPKYKLDIPMAGHSLLASSLGLLLSYRTSSAYARFYEARGLWTKTKSTCRNMAVMVRAHMEPQAPKASKKFLELLAAFPTALMHLCLGGATRLPDHVSKLVPTAGPNSALPAGIQLCMQMQKVAHDIAMESRKMDDLHALHLNALSHMIDVLLDCFSGCEKILKTPVPWTYSRHTSRFLTLWSGTLPFALIETLGGPLTFAVVLAICYCMFGIEEISHLIEMPFLGDDSSEEMLWGAINEKGEAAPLLKRGLKSQPYDFGIPVCSLAAQIRSEVLEIANDKKSFAH